MTTVIRVRNRAPARPTEAPAHAPKEEKKPRPENHGRRGWHPRLKGEIRGMFSGFGEV